MNDPFKVTARTIKRSPFGMALQEARERASLSRTELGKKIRRRGSAISGWENGYSTPSLAVFVELCGILRVTPNKLLKF